MLDVLLLASKEEDMSADLAKALHRDVDEHVNQISRELGDPLMPMAVAGRAPGGGKVRKGSIKRIGRTSITPKLPSASSSRASSGAVSEDSATFSSFKENCLALDASSMERGSSEERGQRRGRLQRGRLLQKLDVLIGGSLFVDGSSSSLARRDPKSS
jgi:hypothetical protein